MTDSILPTTPSGEEPQVSAAIPDSSPAPAPAQDPSAVSEDFVLEDPPEPVVETDTRAPANHTTKLHTRASSDHDIGRETMPLPSMSSADYELMENATPLQAVGESDQIRAWMAHTNTARYYLPKGGVGQGVLARDDAMWVPGVEYEGKLLRGARSTPAHQVGKSYSGEAARLRIRTAAGLGTVFQQPLWHSGFWATVKAPNEGEYLELLQALADEKIAIGNATFGLLLSNTSAYLSRKMFEFFEAHIYDHTLQLAPGENLADYVKAADIPLAILAMARVVWPDGFRFSRACATNPEKCLHIVQEVVTLDEFDPVNANYLTPRQIKHMSKRGRGAMTKQEVKLYTEDFLRGQERTIVLTDDLSMTLKNPTVNEHILAGGRWIDQIQQNFPAAMELDPDQRQGYLQEQSGATEMRQYAHYVDSITAHGAVYSRENPDHVEIIEQALDDFSGDDNIRRKFTEEVIKFQEDGLVSIVAIPSYVCPNCGGEQVPHAKKRKRFPDLIAVDAYRTFFTLLLQKVQKIRSRQTYTY